MNINEDFFEGTFLFKGISEKELKKLLSSLEMEISEYSAQDIIFKHGDEIKKLAFVYSGECTVQRVKIDGGILPLNSVKPYGSFGIISVLQNKEPFPTRIVAKKKSTVIYIDQKSFLKLISQNSRISMNVIEFLAEKVSFLNRKISTFSSDSVEEKLAGYIICESDKSGSSEIFLNAKKASEEIDAGRASLYRVLDVFSRDGFIKHENKKIIILDRIGLERKLK